MLRYSLIPARSLFQKEDYPNRLLAARDLAQKAIVGLSRNTDDPIGQNIYVIVNDIILPRLQKALSRVSREHRQTFRGSDEEQRFEMMVAHIELMVTLIIKRDTLGSRFWATVAKWQKETYCQCLPFSSSKDAARLLREYRMATADVSNDKNGPKAFTAALEKAVERSQVLPEPDSEKAQFSDVFWLRNVYDDPDIKILVASDQFTPEKRLRLQETVDNLLLQQPLFPAECYALRGHLKLSWSHTGA
ncbi:hypothetical protein FRB90_011089 [Tulasnella sp. 427]|nr:hypothetical protein FRB90_011089 [Tulasnella sp. 427]